MTNLRCLPDGQIVETDNFYTESKIRLLWKLSNLGAIQMDDVDGYLHLEHSDADLIVLDPLPVYLESELGDEYVCVTVNRQLGRVVVETSANVYDEVRLDIATLLETPMFCNRSFNVDQLRTVVCAALIEFDVVLAELKETDWLFDGRYQNAVDGGVTALIANPDTSD